MPAWAGEPPILYDVPEAVLVGLVTVLVLAGTWGVLDRRSRGAGLLRQTWRLPGTPYLVAVALALATLGIITDGVIHRRDGEPVLRVDRLVQDAARVAASQPALRETASTLTRLTGEGIVGAVLAGAAFLVAAGRRRDALVVVGGTLGAWALSAGLKVAFAVPRPNRHEPWHAITGYGFPSAHVVVAVVACGLLAWALGREARRGVRIALYAGAVAIGMLAGAARMILNAHWLSDVIAGLAVGVVWLVLVLLSISYSSAPDGARRP